MQGGVKLGENDKVLWLYSDCTDHILKVFILLNNTELFLLYWQAQIRIVLTQICLYRPQNPEHYGGKYLPFIQLQGLPW